MLLWGVLGKGEHVPQKRIPTFERYLARVDMSQGPESCWPWTGGKDQDGYGIFWDGTYQPNGRGRCVRVIRWTYQQFVGHLEGAQQVLHSCDNPSCVNPDHLSAGTAKDNHEQREARGRGRRAHGSAHVGAKLTEGQVLNIRSWSEYVSNKDLAEQFGVSNQLISQIVRRKVWTHI